MVRLGEQGRSRNPYTAINSLFTNASRLMSCASASHHNHLVQPKVREECRCLGHHHFVFIEVLKQVTQVFQSFCTQNCKSTGSLADAPFKTVSTSRARHAFSFLPLSFWLRCLLLASKFPRLILLFGRRQGRVLGGPRNAERQEGRLRLQEMRELPRRHQSRGLARRRHQPRWCCFSRGLVSLTPPAPVIDAGSRVSVDLKRER